MKNLRYIIPIMIAILLNSCDNDSPPFSTPKMVRLSKIVVDSAELENYKALLKEEIEASVKMEPGVLTLYAVFEKDKPTHLTILEMYADTAAYKSHIKTPHFLKYKNGTQAMVKELELIDTEPLLPDLKIK
jgi:quinol monooxygenase YgiN